LVKERPYGDPLHRCSLSLTAVPLCPAGEALVTLAKQTSCKPLADPAAARISEHLRFCSLNFAALPRNIRPAKVRLGRSATSLRMTHSGGRARSSPSSKAPAKKDKGTQLRSLIFFGTPFQNRSIPQVFSKSIRVFRSVDRLIPWR